MGSNELPRNRARRSRWFRVSSTAPLIGDCGLLRSASKHATIRTTRAARASPSASLRKQASQPTTIRCRESDWRHGLRARTDGVLFTRTNISANPTGIRRPRASKIRSNSNSRSEADTNASSLRPRNRGSRKYLFKMLRLRAAYSWAAPSGYWSCDGQALREPPSRRQGLCRER